ncbi:MAG: ABC transporter substrate-binding protein [Candidatus Nanoarchaeia archaeon]
MTKIRAALALFMIIFLMTAGCSHKTKEPVELKVGFMPISDCLQLFVAQDKGFFAEEGLKVEPVPMAGGALLLPALESGDLDIAFSNTISVFIKHDDGSDIKLVVPGAFKDKSHNVFKLVVAEDSRIDEPKDIEGKKVAVNTFKNIVELNLKVWADKNGVDYSKINVVEVPFTQMESALKTREVDAVLVVEPYPTMSIIDGVGKILDDKPLDTLADEFMIAGWFAKQSWIKNNPERLAAFDNAMSKATKYILENPEEMPSIVSEYTALRQDVADKIVMPAFKGEASKSDIQVLIDVSYKYGYISERFDAAEITSPNLRLK